MESGLKLVSQSGTAAKATGRNWASKFDREFAGVPVPCVRLDPRGLIVAANAAAVGLLHLPRDDQATTLASFVQAPDLPRFFRFLQEASSMSRLCEATLRFRCGNGRARSVQVHAGASASKGRGIVLSLIDVTPRVEVAEQLRVAEASIRGLLGAVPQPAFVVAGGEVVASNAAAADLVGEEPLGNPLAKFVGRGQRKALRCCLDTDWVAGSVQRLDIVFARAGARSVAAETLWLAFSFEGRRATLCLVLTDFAAAVRESQDAERERLEAIGGIASSLGHSLNNALTCLGMTIGELSERALGGAREVGEADKEELLDAVTDGLERLSRGVRQLQSIVKLSNGDSDRPETRTGTRAHRVTRELPSRGGGHAATDATGRADGVTRELPRACDAETATVLSHGRAHRVRRELPSLGDEAAGRRDGSRPVPIARTAVQTTSHPVTRELPPLGEDEAVRPEGVDKIVVTR